MLQEQIKKYKNKTILFVSIIFVITILLTPYFGNAEVLSSSDFKVLDPVLAPGGYSTSNNYRLQSVITQASIGTSTATSFNINAGFLFFPFVSTPAVSATPGDGQVSLSWTAASGILGWTVSGYTIGQSTTSGGPYTYTSVGNVLSSDRTALTNGTTYYFIVNPEDAFGNSIATSSEVSGTPVTPEPSDDGGGGSGGGGGGSIISIPSTNVVFSGRAYPLSRVSILKDGQIVVTTIAGPDSNFTATLSGLTTGNYNFAVYGEDKNNLRSPPFTFPIYITSGVTTKISGIFIAPTIAVDKSEVRRGDSIAIFGQSAPASEITIIINSEEEFFLKKQTDADGVYLLNFNTSVLEIGQHTTKSNSTFRDDISQFSYGIAFLVGNKNVFAEEEQCVGKGDLNSDCRVNLVDFSIAAFWYKQSLSTLFGIIEENQLNGDGKVDLRDFSIMAFYWTG